MKLKIPNKQALTKFLDSFAKVGESFIMNIGENINIVAASSDNTLIVYGEFKCDTEFVGKLNIPDGRKFVRLLESIMSNDIELIINPNNVEYRSKSVKFKYHVLEDEWLRPPSLKVDKIKAFEYDHEYVIPTDSLRDIIRSSSYTPEIEKVYLSVEDGALIAELTDKSKHNVDAYTLQICEASPASFSSIIKIDNIRTLNLISNKFKIGINEQFGVVLFYCETLDTTLYYILTTQVK